jgi:hypothetical protein
MILNISHTVRNDNNEQISVSPGVRSVKTITTKPFDYNPLNFNGKALIELASVG